MNGSWEMTELQTEVYTLLVFMPAVFQCSCWPDKQSSTVIQVSS